MGGLAKKLLGTGKQEKLYVDDVFSTYLYTGNGSTQTINNGIDLAGEGGLVWLKERTANGTGTHLLYDTSRGASKYLRSQGTNGQITQTAPNLGLSSFLSSGFSLADDGSENTNRPGSTYASWTFRRAPKFFDVVTYTGDGVAGRQIPHGLGIEPGMIVVKRTDNNGDWFVGARRSSDGAYYCLKLNSTASGLANINESTDRLFSLNNATSDSLASTVNINGAQYVAYLFAHDDSEDGIIQCGSYTTDASGNATVNLGWEPQYLLLKSATQSGSYWNILDAMRGFSQGDDKVIYANLSNGEETANFGAPNATGFSVINFGSPNTIIYLAIRRPNKPPTSGTEVYNAIAVTPSTGTNRYVGFAADLGIAKSRAIASPYQWVDRLRGISPTNSTDSRALSSSGTDAEATSGQQWTSWYAGSENNTVRDGQYLQTLTSVFHFFRRAPGFMDVVCDTGTGATHAISHNLTVAPELAIRKSRSASTQWEVWHSALAANEKLVLNSNAAKAADANAWNSTAPGASSFTVGTGANVNANGATFVTYLFATLAGISKVGSYVGNGGSQTIDCGFTTGARFFLVKAVSAAGSWWVYDSARGIVAAADPALQLNSTVAEITSADAVDPHASGIIVNQEATCSINASGVTYAFLAIA